MPIKPDDPMSPVFPYREEPKAVQNTDRELYREQRNEPLDPDNYYSPSVHVTEDGKIGMKAGGMVFVMSIPDWVTLAAIAEEQGSHES